MAHSNRQKLRDERGGKTRHQFSKAGRSSRYKSLFNAEERIRELNKLEEERIANLPKKGKSKKVDTPQVVVVQKKPEKVSSKQKAVDRRSRALTRLTKQLAGGNKEIQMKVIKTLPDETYVALLESTASTFIVPLEERDNKRIKKEIEILKTRGAVLAA